MAGLAGGLLAGSFGFLLAEPVMDRAVRLEAARESDAGQHAVEVFSRNTQHVGFLVATAVTGLALGTLLGVLSAVVHRESDGDRAWPRALGLAGSGLFGLSLVPFLRYPPNPPGVGDPATIDSRTHLYLSCLAVGVVGVVLAGLVGHRLAERGARPPTRQLAVTGVLLATVALTFVLPADPDRLPVPAALLWQFRLLSLGTLLLLWGGLGAMFGLLGERAARAAGAPGSHRRAGLRPGAPRRGM